MRIYHRCLGYFLAGIMAMYAISGITLIFRETNFLKQEKQIEKQSNRVLTTRQPVWLAMLIYPIVLIYFANIHCILVSVI
jgi:hypothetical protein